MNLIINNLGPISQAKIDFEKPISVFCGPNNTGKTYLSYILYAFTRRRLFLDRETLTDEQVRAFFVDKLLVYPLDMGRLYDALMEKMANISSEDLSTIYGLSEAKAKNLFPSFKMGIDLNKEEYAEMLTNRTLNFDIYYKGSVLARVSKARGETSLNIINNRMSVDESDRDVFKHDFVAQLYYRLLNIPVYDSHFFPVERNSLYTYYKDILSNRNQMLDFLQGVDEGKRQAAADFVAQNSSRYPLAISHTLDAANRMSSVAQEKGAYARLADEIEQDVLGGRLSLTDDGDLKFSSNKSPKKDVPLYLSASLTKAISGLVFCLRHTCGPNDMIFIDEPEVNCHPDVQILLTRIFARMVNAGLRLVISTHSDYVIRELNNLIMLSGAFDNMEEQLAEWGYSREMVLSHSDVGAYLFDYGKNNRVSVKPIEVTDSGFEVKTIDKAISRLNEISESLYYELRYGHGV